MMMERTVYHLSGFKTFIAQVYPNDSKMQMLSSDRLSCCNDITNAYSQIFPIFTLMIHKIKTYTTVGLEGYEIVVEVDSNKSLPMIEIIGLPDTAIKEAKERIRSTFRNVGLDLPNRKIILNLAPSDIRKIGTSFDLPMAVSILALLSDSHISHGDLMQSGLFFGELGLDGMIKRVNGLLPMVICALRQ